MASRKIVLVGGAAAIGLLINKIRKLLGGKDKYEGLGDAVAYSSRKIAAARAMENEEENPLFADPLAADLAGPRAMAAARARQQAAPADSGRRIKINLMAIRTKWFDDQLEASLGMPMGRAADSGDYIATTAIPGHAPRQVVLLGAGMDARAWRLRLPADLKWFELDVQGVLEAKEILLAASGAEVEPTSPTTKAKMNRDQSFNTILQDKIGVLDHHASGVKYPLRAESWVAVPADLGESDWVAKLEAAGFDRKKPTVWVAEGLLMYLTPERAASLLREASSVSAPGSAFLTVSVTEEVINDIKAKGSSSELMGTWKFGCPSDPREWLESTGWKAKLVASRGYLAKALNVAPELCAFSGEGQAKDGRSLFIAATPVAA